MQPATTPAWTVLRTPDNGSIEIGYNGDGTVNLSVSGTSWVPGCVEGVDRLDLIHALQVIAQEPA